MNLKAIIGKIWANRLVPRTYLKAKQASEIQQNLLLKLLHTARETNFGKAHNFSEIRTSQEYRKAVPIRSYEELIPWIERTYAGEPNILWPDKPLYFASTSGTTAGHKHIPISKASMPYHISSALDALLFYLYHSGNGSFLKGKMNFLSGSPELTNNPAGIADGRLSGIAHHHVPAYLTQNRLPSFEVNCIEDWETKVERMLDEAIGADLRLISGIPPWMQMFLERASQRTGKKPCQIWPNLTTYIHGGVDFRPYKPLIIDAIGKEVDFIETYPASEGFIAFQDDYRKEGLLLRFQQGIYFEFVPLERYGELDAPRLSLSEVELDVNYALILTTNAGLWAYSIGDTVRFVSLDPPRIQVTGRVKHFISAFGEHVIQEEVNGAMADACQQTDALVNEFTVAPFVSDSGSYHEWWVEFLQQPLDLQPFADAIDVSLQNRNSYYKDLRKGEMLLKPVLRILRTDACRDYMKSIGKLGGQNKFPRLTNDRKMADALRKYLQN